ncbi:RWD domain-containing 1 [Micractinium conductrix]|uniref:RWD domain-containing 1 n=1 Tax=Micractinium conductrix TaxID=554055 RepID=A0A2P6VAA4_9CHLO|nr:RWD domain-containing 1 [Micractinium conductrix]|eukprot:PSC71022.1 RWD domain-containing 1 [Micractinium conductrix]
MTDYTQEQADELEALASIFADDLEEVTDSIPMGWNAVDKVWSVEVKPQQDDDAEMEYPLKVELVFAHTPTYPDEPPLLKARALQGISDADVGMLQSVLEGQISENLGMAMIYTLISAAQEWVTDKAAGMAMPSADPESEERRRRAAEEERLAEIRRHGHPVTPETFAEWKAKFDAEQALERAKLDGGKGEDKSGRPNGKQWFLQQEAAHIEIEEPDLEADEEDGEDDRANWDYGHGAEGEEEEEDLDFDEDDDDSDEELLEELLASKAS